MNPVTFNVNLPTEAQFRVLAQKCESGELSGVELNNFQLSLSESLMDVRNTAASFSGLKEQLIWEMTHDEKIPAAEHYAESESFLTTTNYGSLRGEKLIPKINKNIFFHGCSTIIDSLSHTLNAAGILAERTLSDSEIIKHATLNILKPWREFFTPLTYQSKHQTGYVKELAKRMDAAFTDISIKKFGDKNNFFSVLALVEKIKSGDSDYEYEKPLKIYFSVKTVAEQMGDNAKSLEARLCNKLSMSSEQLFGPAGPSEKHVVCKDYQTIVRYARAFKFGEGIINHNVFMARSAATARLIHDLSLTRNSLVDNNSRSL